MCCALVFNVTYYKARLQLRSADSVNSKLLLEEQIGITIANKSHFLVIYGDTINIF